MTHEHREPPRQLSQKALARRLASRRAVLHLGLAGLGGAILAACGGGDDDDETPAATSTETSQQASPSASGTTPAATATTPAATSTATSTAASDAPLTAADFGDQAVCQLSPETTEGPYYIDVDMLRQDITEGAAGVPLRVGLRVVDAACEPLEGAVAEIWHCDAIGDYSAFAADGDASGGGEGTTFLRGSQQTNAEGIAEFLTIYPGWYRGRAVHVHLKVHTGGRTVLTSQLFFPEDITDAVYTAEPYAATGERDTRNETDNIYGGNTAQLATVRDETTSRGPGKLALLILGLAASANA